MIPNCQPASNPAAPAAAGDYEKRSLRVLKKWGTYVSVLAKGDLLAALWG